VPQAQRRGATGEPGQLLVRCYGPLRIVTRQPDKFSGYQKRCRVVG